MKLAIFGSSHLALAILAQAFFLIHQRTMWTITTVNRCEHPSEGWVQTKAEREFKNATDPAKKAGASEIPPPRHARLDHPTTLAPATGEPKPARGL